MSVILVVGPVTGDQQIEALSPFISKRLVPQIKYWTTTHFEHFQQAVDSATRNLDKHSDLTLYKKFVSEALLTHGIDARELQAMVFGEADEAMINENLREILRDHRLFDRSFQCLVVRPTSDVNEAAASWQLAQLAQ